MTTAAARETISRESARGNISANLALVLRHLLDEHDALADRVAQLEASAKKPNRPEATSQRDEWALGAKV